MATSMIDIVQHIARSLNIDIIQQRELVTLVQQKIDTNEIQDTREFSPDMNQKIRELLEGNNNRPVRDFEENVLKKNYTQRTLTNFNTLKYNLGKLQILVLLKKIEKATNNEEILNMLFNALSNQLKNVNEIMTINLKGGGINNNISDSNDESSSDIFYEKNISDNSSSDIWYNKYLKYKIKYLELCHKKYLKE